MVVADINQDGFKDFVLSDRQVPGGNGTFSVYDGQTSPPFWKAEVPVPKHTRMIVDDLDGDGRSDVVILSTNSTTCTTRPPIPPATVCIYIQPQAGFWGMREATATIWAPGAIDITTGELDGTAGHDVAVLYPDRAVVFSAQPAPIYYDTSSNWTLTNTTPYTRAMVADVDNNTHDDLVLANPNEVKVFFGTPSGISDNCMINCKAYRIPGSQTGNVSIVVDDILGDDRPDIAVAVSNSSNSAGTIVILTRIGDPVAWEFTEGFRATGREFTDQLTFGDFNADGAKDLAVVIYSRGAIAVFYRNPGGTFDVVFDLLLNGTIASEKGESGKDEMIGHGDFNNDGLEDIALRSPNSVSFFLQQDSEVRTIKTPTTCPLCPHFNHGESGERLINLSDYFYDDHGPINYSITQSSPDIVASLDGTYLDFTVVTQGWIGVMRFNVSANDLYLGHQPAVRQFEVMVNGVPVITSTPPAQVTLGGEYDYLPVIHDPSAVPRYNDSHTFTTIGVTPSGLSVDVNSGLVKWRPTATGNFTITIQATDNYGAKSAPQTFTITVLPKPDEPPSGPLGIPLPNDTNGMIVLIAILGAILLISSILAVNENAKYGFLLMLLPLYSKIKREKVLDHFIRGQIFGYVMANPGEHYNAIKQALDITNGSLAHHLRTLEREHFVQSKRFGLYRRFYPWAMRVPEDGYFRMNEIQKSILALCRNQPGVSQKELAGSLNLTPPTINYHIAILAEHGHVSVIRRGRKTQIYVLKGAEDEAHRQVPH